MVNNRKSVNVHTSTTKPIRSRHYSTTHNTPRLAYTPTQIEPANPNPLIKPGRKPLVEAHFSEGAIQPFIHDFRVRLLHGHKESPFRVFVKRGQALTPNACAAIIAGDVVIMRVAANDKDSAVNMRRTDRPMANFVFRECLHRISRFQSAERTRLPTKDLVIVRQRAFPGLA
ncbi:hypothetical protein C8F04DRAFT_1282788 [Mycena alexandri]|uniref:Uncharacterized protein n=1 Tax=Mycena alexandri TaxID=1745969 RepID=A0AAD6RX23_9AGAR|nr:hypothetical protein C8F04DRAFT_1282788 [Mycena alexandri]